MWEAPQVPNPKKRGWPPYRSPYERFQIPGVYKTGYFMVQTGRMAPLQGSGGRARSKIRHLRCLPHSGVFAILTVRANHSWRATDSPLGRFVTRTFESSGLARFVHRTLLSEIRVTCPNIRAKTPTSFLRYTREIQYWNSSQDSNGLASTLHIQCR